MAHTNCDICFDNKYKKIELQCKHSFCRNCILKIQSHIDKTTTIVCPMCRYQNIYINGIFGFDILIKNKHNVFKNKRLIVSPKKTIKDLETLLIKEFDDQLNHDASIKLSHYTTNDILICDDLSNETQTLENYNITMDSYLIYEKKYPLKLIKLDDCLNRDNSSDSAEQRHKDMEDFWRFGCDS